MRRVLVVLLCMTASRAWAEVTAIEGGDPMDDSTFSGIVMTSNDGRANVAFICDSDDTMPRILFTHSEFLTSSGNTFTLASRIDKEEAQTHYFVARPDNTSGRFFIRDGLIYGLMYKDRAGKEPNRADYTDYSEYDKLHDAWEKRIHGQFVTEFVEGNTALIRVWDYNEKTYTYRFDLSGLVKNLSAIQDCYSRP